MKLEIHIHHHTVDAKAILAMLDRIDKRTTTMATDLTRITSEVTEMSDAVDGAVALLGELAQMIRDNATDPAALNALADQLDSKGTELAEAVTANTPAEPDPAP